MIRVRRSEDRGFFDHGWLKTYHTFSFASYHDPEHVRFRSLRVLNEDWVAPAAGFPTHPHRDMEILTVVLEGELRHKDSLGNGSLILPGEVQRMSAGTGVLHSEENPSEGSRLHLLQIWLLPERMGIEPGYEQTWFGPDEWSNRLRLVASRDGAEGSVSIHQDARLYRAALDSGRTLEHPLAPGRHAWLQMIAGGLAVDGETLRAGDGAAMSDLREVRLEAREPSELLLFDLA